MTAIHKVRCNPIADWRLPAGKNPLLEGVFAPVKTYCGIMKEPVPGHGGPPKPKDSGMSSHDRDVTCKRCKQRMKRIRAAERILQPQDEAVKAWQEVAKRNPQRVNRILTKWSEYAHWGLGRDIHIAQADGEIMLAAVKLLGSMTENQPHERQS